MINNDGCVNIGYLICRECKGYYELSEEEHPDDFEYCQCGGDLVYSHNFDTLSTVLSFAEMDDKLQEKLNEILILEQSIQNKKNVNSSRKKGSILKKLSNSFTRD